MNKHDELLKNSLENIASREFPASATLLRGQPSGSPHAIPLWQRRPALGIALGVIALATVAFAFYTLFFDPGLMGVRDAGLGGNPNQSAWPTLLPPTPTSALVEVPPAMLDQSQTRQGVTVDLEWIALNQTGLVVGFRVAGLPDGQTIGMPEAAFDNVDAQDFRGRILQFYAGAPLTAEFTSLQVVNDPRAENGVDLSLQIPLTDEQGAVLDTFIFPLKSVPANSTSPRVGQFSRSEKIDNLLVRLDWAKITPAQTQVKFCYTKVQGARPLDETEIHVQSGYPAQVRGTGAPADSLLPAPDEDGLVCAIAQFNRSLVEGSEPLLITIDRIADKTRSWDLLVEPTERGPFNEAPAPVPTPRPTLDSQSAGGLSANLIWAYADQRRVALELKFDGWQNSFQVTGFSGKDAQGAPIEGFAVPYKQDDPSVFLLQLDFVPGMLAGDGSVSMQLDVPVYDSSQPDLPLASFHFDLANLPVYPELKREINQSVTANGIDMRLVSIRYTPSYSTLVLCYNKPPNVGANGDWWPGHKHMTLTIGGIQTSCDSGYFLTDSDPRYSGKSNQPTDLPSIPDGRCIELGFPVGNLASENAQTAVLAIPQLEVSLPEVIPQAEIDAANAQLQAQGIQVEQHVFTSGSGGGGGGPQFVQKPAGMSDEQALEKLYQALGYQHPGPWVFTFELPGK